MKLCAIAFKPCWQDSSGRWLSDGGHPLQMAGFASLFDEMTLVVHRRKQPGSGGMPLPAGVKIVALRSPQGADFRRKVSVLTNLPHYILSLRRLIRASDVVHTALPSDIGFIGMLLALLYKKKLIARYSGSWVSTRETTVANRMTRGLMRLFAGGRNVMLATGDSSTPPAPGVSWIFSTALSEEELRREPPDCARGLHAPPRLTYIGRLSKEKGVATLIEAVALLMHDGNCPVPSVTIIGDGPLRQPLESLAHSVSADGAIRFAGQLDRVSLNRELADTDLCVQPSLSEGFSKAWLDAFVHGVPVVASSVGAASSVIGESGERGWLVPPGDVKELTDCLRRVLTEPRDWPSLRARCRKYAEGRTLEAWAGKIGEICAHQWGIGLEGGKLKG